MGLSFPLFLQTSSLVWLCPPAGRYALSPPVTGQPHLQPLCPRAVGLTSDGQTRPKGGPSPHPLPTDPHTVCTLRTTCTHPCVPLLPSWRSTADPDSPLLETASDRAFQALTAHNSQASPGLPRLGLSQPGLGAMGVLMKTENTHSGPQAASRRSWYFSSRSHPKGCPNP